MQNSDLDEQIKRATEVQAKYADALLSLPHVVGLGVGFAQTQGTQQNEVAVVVMVDEKVPVAQLLPEAVIPPRLDGVRVDVQSVGGGFSAFST